MDTTESLNLESCKSCALLGTTKLVHGCGNKETKMVIIGRDPGRFEESYGVPFVGRSGELLNDTLEKVGMKRSDFYVTNVVKCRPKRNKTPDMDIVNACYNHLEPELKAINPKVILFLGQDARRVEERLITALPSCIMLNAYHPAAVLRNLSLYSIFQKQLNGVCILAKQMKILPIEHGIQLTIA
jgi:DNA polymerase